MVQKQNPKLDSILNQSMGSLNHDDKIAKLSCPVLYDIYIYIFFF